MSQYRVSEKVLSFGGPAGALRAMRRRRDHQPLLLTDTERSTLDQWARRRKTAQRLAVRSRRAARGCSPQPDARHPCTRVLAYAAIDSRQSISDRQSRVASLKFVGKTGCQFLFPSWPASLEIARSQSGSALEVSERPNVVDNVQHGCLTKFASNLMIPPSDVRSTMRPATRPTGL